MLPQSIFTPVYKCQKCKMLIKSNACPSSKNKNCINNGRHNWKFLRQSLYIKVFNAIVGSKFLSSKERSY